MSETFIRMTDEELGRHYRFIRGPWWGISHPVINAVLQEIRTEAAKRKLDLEMAGYRP